MAGVAQAVRCSLRVAVVTGLAGPLVSPVGAAAARPAQAIRRPPGVAEMAAQAELAGLQAGAAAAAVAQAVRSSFVAAGISR
ncbi:MAG: hypothetical protein M3186_15540 [Actinomycetota bacterium]|nr:hypothetical protein [Actinomycetota bacterium]